MVTAPDAQPHDHTCSGTGGTESRGTVNAPAVVLLAVTDAGGIAHLVTDDATAAGRYLAACGTEVLAASLTTSESGHCRPARGGGPGGVERRSACTRSVIGRCRNQRRPPPQQDRNAGEALPVDNQVLFEWRRVESSGCAVDRCMSTVRRVVLLRGFRGQRFCQGDPRESGYEAGWLRRSAGGSGLRRRTARVGFVVAWAGIA